MSDEYRSQFISSLVLYNDLCVDEFEDFTATIRSSNNPLFKDMVYPWKLKFSIDENNKLAWSAIEYEDEDDDMHGLEVMCGLVRVVVRDEPCLTLEFDDVDVHAHEFIATMFPGRPDVTQLYPDENIFLVNGDYYNFDTMMTKGRFIHFELSD
jgi:hypothetical protein